MTELSAQLDTDAMVELACALIAARGENPGETEAATVAMLARACRAQGFTVTEHEVAPGRSNLIATYGDPDAGPGLLFLGHSDVVPAGPGWSSDPFAPAVRDGQLFGRGSADMKGGLAAIVGAMAAVAKLGAPLRGPVTLACTVDEEDLDTGIRHLVELPEPLPGRYAGCIVAEPTSLDVIVACRGDAYLEIEVTGRAAHSGRPSDGRSAIAAAARIVQLIQDDHDRLSSGSADPLCGTATWNVGRIEGGRGTSTVAPSCHLWVDRRLMPGEDPEQIAADLRQRIEDAGIIGDGISVAIEVTMAMPGFATETDDPFVAACVDAAHSVDYPGAVGGWSAACDGGFIAERLGIPTVVLGPGSINDQAHQPDESVPVSEIHAAAALFTQLITTYLR